MMLIPFLIALALLGLADAGYLLWKYYGPRSGPLVCPFNQACDAVLASRYGRMLGIRNELIGAAYYLLVLALLALAMAGAPLPVAVFGITSPLELAFLISIPAFAASLMLTGIQHFVLKNYCSYCLFANLLNVIIFVGLAIAK